MIIDGDSSDIEQLGEDHDEEEEWCPNDGSSDSSEEEDLRDESVDQTSAEVEGPALQDESVEQLSTEAEGPTTQDTTKNCQ